MKKKTSYAEHVGEIEDSRVDLPPAPTAGASRKLTTSLFPADLEALEKVYEMLRKHCRINPSRSDAIKVGLRILAEGASPEALRKHIAEIKKEDGRNKPKM